MLRHRIVMACIAAAEVPFQAAGFASQAWAQERRVALVLGIDAYVGPQRGGMAALQNAIADACALRDALRAGV